MLVCFIIMVKAIDNNIFWKENKIIGSGDPNHIQNVFEKTTLGKDSGMVDGMVT